MTPTAMRAYRKRTAGRNDRFIDNTVIDEVRTQFDSLSPPTQALLRHSSCPQTNPGTEWVSEATVCT